MGGVHGPITRPDRVNPPPTQFVGCMRDNSVILDSRPSSPAVSYFTGCTDDHKWCTSPSTKYLMNLPCCCSQSSQTGDKSRDDTRHIQSYLPTFVARLILLTSRSPYSWQLQYSPCVIYCNPLRTLANRARLVGTSRLHY